MRKILHKIKNNILLRDYIFILFNLVINFTLSMLNVRFKTWLIILIILISVIGFIAGLIQVIYKSSDKKKLIIISVIWGLILLILLFVIFMPFILFVAAFSYKPEHTTYLDGKKYVATVSSFLHVDVDYYDYYGPFLMGTKVRVHGDFGKGGFDPFKSKDLVTNVEYTYYDDNGKITAKKEEVFNEKSKSVDKYDVSINTKKDYDISDDYLLPEDEEVLYEKKFDDIILRFGKVDSVLGQNMLVNVLRSKDNGKNFYAVTDDVIKVSNEAKFVFLTQDQGFAISDGKIYLNENKTGIYVTNDGGKTFSSAKFNYYDENTQYITIDGLPHYQKDVLIVKCFWYHKDKDEYENTLLTFTSNDKGLTWNIK